MALSVADFLAREVGGAKVPPAIEICEASAKSAEVSVVSLLDELEAARVKATSLGQLSAAVRASVEKGSLAGLTVDRAQVEVVNAESDGYAEATSIEQVLGKMFVDFGFESTELVARAMGYQICEDGVVLDIQRSTPRPVANIAHLLGKAGQPQPVLEWTPPRKS